MAVKTAKLYHFRFSLYPCTFEHGYRTVALGCARDSRYLHVTEWLTFKAAQEKLIAYSLQEARSHCASLGMASPGDRAPPGFSTHQPIYFNADPPTPEKETPACPPSHP
jgi:hypothetical protein